MSDIDTLRRLRRVEDILSQLKTNENAAVTSGVWTPTYLGDATPGVTTYVGAPIGYWYRMGNLVIVSGRVEWSAATGTGSGVVYLPYTVSSATDYRAPLTVSLSSIVFASGYVIGNPIASTNTFGLVNVQSNVVATTLPINTAGGVVAFAGVYAM